MKVYKFGGASVKDVNSIKNVAQILSQDATSGVMVVVSAMDKTTNLLEKLTHSYFSSSDEIQIWLQEVKNFHFKIAEELFTSKDNLVFNQLNNYFVEIDWILEDQPQDEFDFIYDQIVSMGELLSSCILSNYLNQEGIKNTLLDVRSCIITDNVYREGNVDWSKTSSLITKIAKPILNNQLIVTQGFIGCTTENFTTTLGREGSDYTAAIFGNCLDAESVTIWKDVPGVLNADPKLFNETTKFDTLPYSEAIEMSYYGATVIHPKTLKPLQNKNIPLFVRSFNAPTENGTKICLTDIAITTPIIIVKPKQILISLSTENVAYISENHLKEIFNAFAQIHVKVNTMQVSALSFSACFDDDENKFEKLYKALHPTFKVKYNKHLQLITIRHYNKSILATLSKDKTILLEQLSRNTAQLVLQDKM